MSEFHVALDAFLKGFEGGEITFAKAVGCTQATINRYRNGKRFPDAATARLIDEKSDGAVPFDVWQGEFLSRSGIAA